MMSKLKINVLLPSISQVKTEIPKHLQTLKSQLRQFEAIIKHYNIIELLPDADLMRKSIHGVLESGIQGGMVSRLPKLETDRLGDKILGHILSHAAKATVESFETEEYHNLRSAIKVTVAKISSQLAKRTEKPKSPRLKMKHHLQSVSKVEIAGLTQHSFSVSTHTSAAQDAYDSSARITGVRGHYRVDENVLHVQERPFANKETCEENIAGQIENLQAEVPMANHGNEAMGKLHDEIFMFGDSNIK